MDVTRIFDLLPYHEATFKPKPDVVASKENGEWNRYSIKQYREIVDYISYGFLEMGVQPGILSTGPRLLEKIYDKLFSTGHKLKGVKRWIFFWALHLALRYELKGANGWFYELKRKIYDRLVYVKWRQALGGKHLLIVSGGAALQPRLARMFTCAGIDVLEGYGLTETSPVVAVNDLTENGRMFGTVGLILKDVTVRIADDGEILCKGPNVMKG